MIISYGGLSLSLHFLDLAVIEDTVHHPQRDGRIDHIDIGQKQSSKDAKINQNLLPQMHACAVEIPLNERKPAQQKDGGKDDDKIGTNRHCQLLVAQNQSQKYQNKHNTSHSTHLKALQKMILRKPDFV